MNTGLTLTAGEIRARFHEARYTGDDFGGDLASTRVVKPEVHAEEQTTS